MLNYACLVAAALALAFARRACLPNMTSTRSAVDILPALATSLCFLRVSFLIVLVNALRVFAKSALCFRTSSSESLFREMVWACSETKERRDSGSCSVGWGALEEAAAAVSVAAAGASPSESSDSTLRSGRAAASSDMALPLGEGSLEGLLQLKEPRLLNCSHAAEERQLETKLTPQTAHSNVDSSSWSKAWMLLNHGMLRPQV